VTKQEVGRPTLVDRLELRMSTGRVVDGLWIGTFEAEEGPILERVEQALQVIKTHDPRRYDRLRRDLSRIWVRLLTGDRGCFNATLRACELDSRFVLDSNTTPVELAATIVHESAHARIEQCGIAYRRELRHRIEAACRRQEIAFANRLPDGVVIRERADEWLATPSEFWSDDAFEERYVDGTLSTLRYLGVPVWLLPILRKLRVAARTIRRLASGLTSA
jgi:hypothetical protein